MRDLCAVMTSLSRVIQCDKTVTILDRLVTWVCVHLDLGTRSKFEADPRHREIFLAHMNLIGANPKSVTTPTVKVQEWTPQMLTKLDKDRASMFRSTTMRANHTSIDRQQAVKEVARFMAEPNEGAWSMLKRLVRCHVDHGRRVQVISEQRHVKARRVDTDRDACLPGTARRVRIFSMASTCSKPEVGRKVHAI